MDNLEKSSYYIGAKLGRYSYQKYYCTIMNKISASKAGGKNDKETIIVLEEIINKLLEDKMN